MLNKSRGVIDLNPIGILVLAFVSISLYKSAKLKKNITDIKNGIPANPPQA